MLYFSSDHHMNHEAAIRMCNRPFATVEEMNRTLIDNINARVHKNDTLYLLGDITNKGTVASANELIAQIKCPNKILVRGNHDKNYDKTLFKEIHNLTEIHVGMGGKNYSITLCHFDMNSWYKSRHGSLHLHGHIHSKYGEYNFLMREQGIRRYDVGVDANHFMPVSLEEILTFMGV